MKKLEFSMPDLPDPPTTAAETPKRDLQLVRVEESNQIASAIENELQSKERSLALTFARSIALAWLPRTKTKEHTVVRELQLGTGFKIRVTYTAAGGSKMPFGEDRFVLAGIQDLAVKQDSARVSFENVGDLLKEFGLSRSGSQYRDLRQRLNRLKGLNVDIELIDGNDRHHDMVVGVGMRVIEEWAMPTRRRLAAEGSGQLTIEGSPYYVQISQQLMNYLRSSENQLIVRMDLLKKFVNRPLGWDYLVFLAHRCGAARSSSVVPHSVLMEMFKSGNQSDSRTIETLRGFHEEIMLATGHRLEARIIEMEPIRNPKGGRPRKQWGLQVGPSQTLITSGRREPRESLVRTIGGS